MVHIRLAIHSLLEKQRRRLARSEGLILLSLLGVVCGLAAGGMILAFRFVVEAVQLMMLSDPEDFENLSTGMMLTLPVAGGLLVGVMMQILPETMRSVGILHVIERLTYHHARLPVMNMMVQFITASMSLICGHSVGREGPSVHLGAASASLFGQSLRLPNNSIRILVACGSAASIAASFNTPLAGVVFAMEVVVMEYTISGFAPIILAAVVGAGLSRAVYGAAPAFLVPQMEMASLWELPVILCIGLLAGFISAAFNLSYTGIARLSKNQPIWIRCTLAGIVVGVCASYIPQVMGVGYDTVDGVLSGDFELMLLLGILLAKFIATSAGLGMGLPGGLIGPTLFIGACAGGVLSGVLDAILPQWVSSPGFYALLGMAAMMGASLQAPLAALTAMLELTQNAGIILPGMFAVIVAYLVHREILKQNSIYLALLHTKGLSLRTDPVTLSLQRIGVAGRMNSDFVRLQGEIGREALQQKLKQVPAWFVLFDKDREAFLVAGAEFARYLLENPDQQVIDPWNIAVQRLALAFVTNQSSMLEARDNVLTSGAQAICVLNKNIPGVDRVVGVLLPQDIEKCYA